MLYFCCASPSPPAAEGVFRVFTCFCFSRIAARTFSTRPLNSSDSAAMPSGPFILSRTTLTFAGRMTTLRIVVSFLLIFGCRNWARAIAGASAEIRTAMSVMLVLGNFLRQAIEKGKVIAGVSLDFQCACGFVLDRSQPALTQDTFRIQQGLRSSGRASRTTCQDRGALRPPDYQRSVHAGKTLPTSADVFSNSPGRPASPEAPSRFLRRFASRAFWRHLSWRCSSARSRLIAAPGAPACDTLPPAKRDFRSQDENRPDVARCKPLNEIARLLSATEHRGASSAPSRESTPTSRDSAPSAESLCPRAPRDMNSDN